MRYFPYRQPYAPYALLYHVDSNALHRGIRPHIDRFNTMHMIRFNSHDKKGGVNPPPSLYWLLV